MATAVVAMLLILLPAAVRSAPVDTRAYRDQIVETRAELVNLERALREALASSSIECIIGASPGAEGSARCGGIDEKVSEGQILFQLGDYERASILLYDVVFNVSNQSSSTYDDAVFYLAESLYAAENYAGARTYYRKTVEHKSELYAQDAILRLIEIAGKFNDYTDLDAYFDDFLRLSGGSVRPEIAYVRGKHLLLAGRVQEAIDVLQQIPRSNKEGLNAAYLHGVALLTQGGPEATTQAVEIFRSVSDATPRSESERQVVELAHMAQGRLFYELGDLERSADAYQNIPRDSIHFTEMLFEVTWTFIKRGQLLAEEPEDAKRELHKAIQALDILLIAAPTSRMAPDINILRGNLYLRLAEHDNATEAFKGVIQQYRPTLDKLDKLMAERGDPRRLLDDILAADASDLTVDSLLPPLAARWAQGQEEIDDALRVYKELRSSKQEVASARKVVSRITRVLDAENRVELFPAVAEVHARGLTLRDRMLHMRAEIADRQLALVPTAAAAELRSAAARRRGLEDKFNSIPRTTQGLETRAHRIENRITALEKRLFMLSIALDSELAMLAAMNKYAIDLEAVGKLEGGPPEYWASGLTQERAVVDGLREHERLLREELKREREDLTLTGGPGSQERQIRGRLHAALQREADLLAAARGSTAGPARQQLRSLDTVNADVVDLLGRADAFQANLDSEVTRRADRLRGEVAKEAANLDTYERAVLQYEAEASDVAANAAVLALRGVRDSFYDFVLRADVGIVDSAWQRKKDKSDEISRLMRRQRAELQALDHEFGEVLRPED